MNQIYKFISTSKRFHNIYKLNNSNNSCNSFSIINSNNQNRFFSTNTNKDKSDLVTFTFINKDGSKTVVSEPVGTNVLEAAHENDVDLEGACECSCACSTCHVHVQQDYFDKLPEPTDEENDMLDLAFDLKENSRLGCQIKLSKELEGMVVSIPSASRNMSVDGYKPPRH